MNRDIILNELVKHQGRLISGAELGNKLGLTRVAIHKHIEALRAQGYEIISVTGQGYCLSSDSMVVIPQRLAERVSTRMLGKNIIYSPQVDSTNQALKRVLNTEKLPEGTVYIGGRQTGGKGRLGRYWESPPGGLWFSFLLRPRITLDQLALLSLVFALALSKALDSYLPVPAAVKWPNDLLVKGKKLGGILLEVSGEWDGADYLITGAGINVNTRRDDYSPRVRELCTSILEESSRPVSGPELLIHLLESLEQYYFTFLQEGFGNMLGEYKTRCQHLNQVVEIKMSGQTVRGLNTDISTRGHLILDDGRQTIEISSGDVTMIETGRD